MLKIVVCGPRRSKQGIGEYIIKFFHLAGTKIVGIVSTSEKNNNYSLEILKEKYNIDCNGYLSLEEAIELENPDIVVICTPIETHEELLKIVLRYEKHCLCEKPLVWSENPKEVELIVDKFIEKKRFLDVITQWPYTIPFFNQLYPQCSKELKTFDMLMGPISCGKLMVIDSMPHVLSMLSALVGQGKVEGIECQREDKHMCIAFKYVHKYSTKVTCTFIQTEKQPRPASYSINGLKVDRVLDVKEYQIFLQNKHQKIMIEDPLFLLVKDYIFNIEQQTKTNKYKLINEIDSLSILYENI